MNTTRMTRRRWRRTRSAARGCRAATALGCALVWAHAAASQEALPAGEPNLPPTFAKPESGLDLTGAPTLVSRPDGSWMGGAHGYRARFDDRGTEFLPALGATAERAMPLRMSLLDVGRGDLRYPGAPATKPVVEDLQVRFQHATCIERYDVRSDGIALSFEFPEPLPGHGDLRVCMKLDTQLRQVSADEPGVALHLPGIGGVHIGAVTGIDADGRRIQGKIELRGDRLELSLPAAFLDDARWPVVLDPLIRRDLQLELTTNDAGADPDIAFEPSSERFCVVWEERFSATSADIRTRVFDRDGRSISTELFVTLNSGTRQSIAPAVASVRLRGRFVIVWQDDSNGHFDICGRSLDANTLSFGPEKNLAGFASEERRPDVGGDPTSTDDDVVLVWHDTTANAVIARQVTVDFAGNLNAASRVTVQTGPPTVGFPRISKSAGAAGRFLIVWIVEQTGHTDVRGRVYDRNLNPVGNAINIASSSLDEDLPDVDGNGREWVVAWEAETTPGIGDNDVVAVPLYLDGPILTRGTQRTIEGQSNDDEKNVSVAWLGGSALVSYLDRRSVTGPFDVYLWSIDPYTCRPCEGKAALQDLGGNSNRFVVACGSHGLAGDTSGDTALIAWQTDSATNQGDIVGALWGAEDGFVEDLGGGCGAGGRALASCARVPNSTFQLRLREAGGLDTVYAMLSFDRIPSGFCGSCTLVADPFRGWIFPVTTDLFGNGSLSLPVPDSSALVGTRLITQWLSPGGTACRDLGGVLSNALFVEIQ